MPASPSSLSRADSSTGSAPSSPSSLFGYQRDAVDKIIARGGSGGLYLDMGTGKTRVALTIAKELGCRRLLIVGPLSVPSVWARELKAVWPEVTFHPAYSGTLATRARAIPKVDLNPVAVFVNYEGYWRQPLRKAILNYRPDLIIYDEAHRLMHRGARQSRFAHQLVDSSTYRLALTGTPMPNGPEDLFSIYKAIDQTVFTKYWSEFEAEYIKKGGFFNYQIVGYRNLEQLKAKLADSSYRVTKDEVLDLPEQTHVVLQTTLSSRKYYDAIRKKALAEINVLMDGQQVKGVALARTVLTNILRLQQLTSGFVRLSDGRYVDLSTEKLDLLDDLLKDAIPQAGRVAVFCRFRRDVDRVAEVAAKHATTLVLDGRTSPKERELTIARAAELTPVVLVLQLAVGALGIDLSFLNVAVFYSVDYSVVNFTQARDRLRRIGQVNRVTYYPLVITGTVDEQVYADLIEKRDLSKQVLDEKRILKFFG